MKTKHFKGMAGLLTTVRIGCAAGIGMMAAQLQAGVSEPAPVLEEEAAELPANWMDITVGGTFIGGDKAAFQRRVGQDGDFYGGISDMHLESTIDDLTWTLDGHAMFGNEDYELILGLQKDNLGYIEAGYREFRTWYDGSGGYMPRGNEWYPAANDELSLDRGELWFEAGLRMEDFPEITFRYTHGWRDGQKDSTMWGIPVDYGIEPSMYQIDEERDIFELDVAHTLGNTDLGLGLRYEMIDNSNDRFIENDVTTDGYEADIFNAHASSVTRFNEQMMLSFGYAFTTLNSDTFVSRTDSILGFNNGGANQNMNVANASFWWNPVKDLVIVPSIRAEWNNADAISNFWYAGRSSGGWARPTVDVDGNTLTEQIEARYQGIENVLIYGKVMFEQEDEDTDWLYYQDSPVLVTDTPSYGLSGTRYKACDADRMKGVVGATWYAMRGLSFAGEYYHKETDLDYDTVNSGSGLTHFGDAHISKLDMSTDNFNLRMTWRPLSNLSLVTRYDWQNTTYDMVGFDGSLSPLPEIESGEYERNVISQSVTWMPIEQAYVQGTVSWISAETDTPANDQVPGQITDSDNDYLMANLTVGYALDKKTDITVGYSYYYSENYALPVDGVGYGSDLEEHVFSVRLNRQINRNMVWNLGYGYYTSNDGTSGGYNDFSANMVSTGLQVRF